MPSNNNRNTPVIKDVARLAGVSVPTVSRYLNGTAKVSDAKREAIAKAIELLGYQPSVVARALANRELDQVMVLTSHNMMWSNLMVNDGIEQAARSHGFLFGVTSLDGVAENDLADTVNRALSANPAGVILSEDDEIMLSTRPLIPRNLPMVLVGGSRGDAPYQVIPSEREGGRLITEHLLSLGHRTVTHVHRQEGPNDNTRTRGWRDAMTAVGLSVDTAIQVSTDLDESVEVGRRLARDLKVTAVFAGNDETAISLIKGLAEGGKRVPEDVSVAGYNDMSFARFWQPPLTSYSQNFQELGRQAFDMLLGLIEAKRAGEMAPEPECRVVPGKLIVRESTAAPRQ